MKTCPNCEQTLPLTDFYADRSKSDGHTSWCKQCVYIRASHKAAKNSKMLKQIKVVSGCEQCGYDEHAAGLFYHHRLPYLKSFNLSKPGARNTKAILVEVMKCDILCGTCHAVLHYKDDDADN